MIPTNLLGDQYGRFMRKLRVSLNDVCNFRCFYCMPEDPHFDSKEIYLKPEEIERICAILVEKGVEQIRLTGGEPLLRQEFDDIALRIANLPIKEFGITTNGYFLKQKLEFLKDINCRNINVSLDSLNKEKFNKITKSHGFNRVYDSIIQAREMQLNVKINTVLMNQLNTDEVDDFVEFSARTGIEVRFLEMMKIGQSKNNNLHYISADSIIAQLKNRYDMQALEVENDSTSFKFSLSNGVKIGFIASESKPFCGACSRLRLGYDGKLRACLMSENGHHLKNMPPEEMQSLIQQTILLKPVQRIHHVDQNMFEIGG